MGSKISNRMNLKKVGVIDYGLGNLGSVVNALKFLNCEVEILKTPSRNNHDHLVLPGVGSFKKGMQELTKRSWDTALKEYAEKDTKILGICLGMQLLFSSGEEDGNTKGLNFFEGHCSKLKNSKNYPIPHIGFNSVFHDGSNIWNKINENCSLYFVHSFAVKDTKNDYKQAKTEYGGEKFISYIERKNIYGAQFHPEKSHYTGLKFLKNFIEI